MAVPFPFLFPDFLEEILSYFLELLWVLCSSRSHMILCDVAEVLSFPVASVGRGSLSCWLMFSVDDSLLTVLSHGVLELYKCRSCTPLLHSIFPCFVLSYVSMPNCPCHSCDGSSFPRVLGLSGDHPLYVKGCLYCVAGSRASIRRPVVSVLQVSSWPVVRQQRSMLLLFYLLSLDIDSLI